MTVVLVLFEFVASRNLAYHALSGLVADLLARASKSATTSATWSQTC